MHGACKLECNCSASRPEEPEPEPVQHEPDPVIDADYEEVPEPAGELRQIGELELSCKTENILRRAGIDTVEELASMKDEELVAVRGMSNRALEEIQTKLNELESADKAALASFVCNLDNIENPPPKPVRIYTLEEVAKEIMRLEAAFIGAPVEVKQSAPYRKNVMRLDAMRLLYDSMRGE